MNPEEFNSEAVRLLRLFDEIERKSKDREWVRMQKHVALANAIESAYQIGRRTERMFGE